MSLAKANSLMRTLREKLVLRLPSTYLFSDSVDASGNPVLTIAQKAPWVTADNYFVIRVMPLPQIGVNSLGLAQEAFTPHVVQIDTEASATAHVSFVKDLVMEPVLFEVFRLGTMVDFYLSTTTVKPVVADFADATKFELRLDDLINPEIITV